MNPSQKSPEMETVLQDIFGFDRRASIKNNRCAPKPIGCGGPAVDFPNDLYKREYAISSLCTECQDKIFG